MTGQKNSAGRGRYSKIIREQDEGIRALESVANRFLAEKDAELAEKDAEIARLRAALELIAGSASDKLQAMHAKAALDNIGATITPQPSHKGCE